ncbi:phenazine biosynthesis protein PhzF [Glutamicibacter uratoxydans]|uniref:Phenazine biosynthesis protein PhzF n=1 Tax=Glutamicibacter uratoxydans TaxID=43667 RepID=A0A4Y4DRA0_GLUUR|nr:PhzF family phenazine biosynthesis protein [Glutamicibacter uratoxydans]GED06454.1 phenazine biosynthesis protein PhzF [Glutamicibacter uratoxydans]
MRTRQYSEVDVFSPTAYLGNPLAVVHDAQELSAEQMQRFAKWTNLAETTFLLPPTTDAADYRVRIFSASQEFPFAGHPTLGSAYAWLQAGGVPKTPGKIVQECGAGLVDVTYQGQEFSFKAPPITRFEPLGEAKIAEVAAALGLEPEKILDSSWIVNGPEWIGIRLASAADVLALSPDPQNLGELCLGVIGPHDDGHDTQFEVRAFLGNDPVWEDPVTGSLNAGLAYWLRSTGVAAADYVAAQGTAIGYEGRVQIRYAADGIWVGGHVNPCVAGQVNL